MRNSDEISRNEKILLEFLAQHPKMFVSRKKIKANPQSTHGQSEILQKIRDAKDKKVIPSQLSTEPDQAVSVILGAWYGIEEGKWEQVKQEHQYSMLAENLVGEFLERYIEQVITENNLGWARAWGDVIRSVDFVKKDGDRWTLLQVKNRDNSENSSSQSVRAGTEIIKWFRTFSKTGKTNWENFPDEKLATLLDEAAFQSYIKSYLISEKKQ